MATIEKRLRKNGKISYRCRIRIKGNPIITGTFSNIEDATKWSEKIEKTLKLNRYLKILEKL